MVLLGGKAPLFCLKDQDGKKHCLKDYISREMMVVLYFYPKDDTSGCTIEAKQFTAMLHFYNRENVKVLGVSPDSVASHKKFARKHRLHITLLSDEAKAVIKKYGVWGKKTFMGKKFEGVLRTTFVIDTKGKIAFVFESVKPQGHAQEVLRKVGVIKSECGLKVLAMPLKRITPEPHY